MSRKFVLILIWIAASDLAAYPQAQPAKPPAQAQPAEEEPPPVLAVPKDYQYNARSRRDPFVNPVPPPKVDEKAPGPPPAAQRPAGLRGVLVAEARIAGVVTSKEPSMNIVIIAAPGGKRYFARVGDALFDAVVKEIQMDTIKFALDSGGARQTAPREIVREVRPSSGENK